MTFILTLVLNPTLQNFFEQQRRQHYPTHLNKIPAHVSVFHQLPEEYFDEIDIKLKNLVLNNPCPSVSISGIKFLGKGNAYLLHFNQTLFSQLRKDWETWLTPQDKQPWQPHITIQNKVSVEKAKLLNQVLCTQHTVLCGRVIGLNLWRYLEGPWELIKTYRFKLF